MIHMRWWGGWLLALGGVGALSGARTSGAEAPETPAVKPPVTEETPEQKAARLLQEASKGGAAGDLARQRDAEREFQEGLKLYYALDYPAAKARFEKAVQLDPTHRAAFDHLLRVNALMGLKTPFTTSLKNMAEEPAIKAQETLAALAAALEDGRRLEEKGSATLLDQDPAAKEQGLAGQLENLRQALARYERVKETLNYLPPGLEMAAERRQAEEAIRRVNQKIESKGDELSFIRRQRAQQLVEEKKVRETASFVANIAKLLEQTEAFYREGEYEAADRLAGRILQLDPLNADAEKWRQRARTANHSRLTEDWKVKYKEETESTWDAIDRSNIPYTNLLTYPPNWDQISRRSEKTGIGRTEAEEQWKSDIRAKLQRKVNFTFVDTPLSEGIAFLRNTTNVTMIIDPKVLEGGDPPITLSVTDMPLELALGWILRLADLDYTLNNKAIFIAKKSAITEDMELKIYDIADLGQAPRRFELDEKLVALPLTTGGTGADVAPALTPPPPAPEENAENMKNLIKLHVAPDRWEGASIEQMAGKLVVMQRPAIHGMIDQLLANFRSTQKIMVNIEARFLTIREAHLEEIGVEFQGLDPSLRTGDFGDIFSGLNPQAGLSPMPVGPGVVSRAYPVSTVGAMNMSNIDFYNLDNDAISGSNFFKNAKAGGPTSPGAAGGLSAQITVLDNPQYQAFIKALTMRENTSTLLAPRLTVYNTQRAHMFVARRRNYVGGATGQGNLTQPTVQTLWAGVFLDVMPTVSSDRRYVTLELRPSVTDELETPAPQTVNLINNVNSINGTTTNLSFQITYPRITIQQIRTSATVPDSGILLIGGLYKNIKYSTENGVPFLGDLPVIGRIFRWTGTENVKSSLAVLVSPRIILFSEEEQKL